MARSKKETKQAKKQRFLKTIITELGVGINLRGYGLGRWTPMTIQEIFDANQSLKGNKDWIKCFRDENGKPFGSFIKDSKKWKDLKTYLLIIGFTHKDWPMLLPEIGTPKRFDISRLSKEQLKRLPFRQVCNVHPGGKPYDALAEFLRPKIQGTPLRNREDVEEYLDIPVSELLNVGYEETEQIIEKNGTHRMYPEDVHGFRKTLCLAQAKLAERGFTGKDGKFMQAYFDKSYKNQMAHLVQNKGFTKTQAKKAIEIGKKAGWI